MASNVAKKSLSAIDEIIMAHARTKSPQEIAKMTGMTAKAIIERTEQILHAPDWLTEGQRERLLLMDVEKMFGDLQIRIADADERNVAGLSNSAKGMVDLMLKVRRAREQIENDLTKIQHSHATIMGQAIGAAFSEFVKLTDMDEETALPLLQEALPKAIGIIEANTVED